MDWDAMAERQRADLKRVVARLFLLAGMMAGAVHATLPRALRLRVLSILRPAEAAARRLIAVAARAGIEGPGRVHGDPPARGRTAKRTAARRDRTDGTARGGGDAEPDGTEPGRYPPFALLDPRRAPRAIPRRRTVPPGRAPRLWFFDGMDPPRESVPLPGPHDPVPAAALCRRILALRDALDDIPAQAGRLTRLLARPGARYTRPMRPGRPPGHRTRRTAARNAFPTVHDILADCHDIALRALHRRGLHRRGLHKRGLHRPQRE